MSFFDFFKIPDINQGVKEFETTETAILLDVRTKQEYKEGHIPNSKNIPLQTIGDIEHIVQDKNTPIFVHCYSGSRSRQAVAILNQIGYQNVKNIGGISSYRGKVVR